MADDKKDGKAPVIIIKKKGGGHGGHHGGAWKVAYADFVTAMMAFFMVMWLMGTDEETKKAISDYFNNPEKYLSASNKGPTPFENEKMSPSQTGFIEEAIKVHSRARKIHINEQKVLEQLQEIFEGSAFNIDVDEKKVVFSVPGFLIFQSGSSAISYEGTLYLNKLSGIFKDFPGQIEIVGHSNKSETDDEDKAWEISFQRALSVRGYLTKVGGVPGAKMTPVGKGTADPFVKDDLADQKNRRVEFILRIKREEA